MPRHGITEAFNHADLPGVIRLLNTEFDGVTYSLRSLVGDDQKRIIDAILASTMNDAEANFRNIFENHASLMRFLAENQLPVPEALSHHRPIRPQRPPAAQIPIRLRRPR